MAWARYGDERGAGPLAARCDRAHAPPARARPPTPTRCGARRRRSAWPTRAGSAGSSAGASRAWTASQTYHELFRAYPFTRPRGVRARRSSPACAAGSGRSPATTPRSTDADAFAAWDEPGTVRVAFAHWVEPLGDGRAELHSEARVQPVDTHGAAAPEGDLGAVVGPFERLVGAEPLELAVRGPRRRPRMPPGWSRTRCARGWMTRIGSRRRAACSPRRAGRRSTALPR